MAFIITVIAFMYISAAFVIRRVVDERDFMSSISCYLFKCVMWMFNPIMIPLWLVFGPENWRKASNE